MRFRPSLAQVTNRLKKNRPPWQPLTPKFAPQSTRTCTCMLRQCYRSHNSFAVHLGTLLALNFISVMPVSAEGPLLQLAGYVIEKSWSFKQSIEIEREKGRAGDGGWMRCFAILTLFYRVGIPQEFRVSAPVSRNWNLGAKEGERHLREKPPARACVTHSSEPFR